MPSSASLVCVDPKRINEIWPYARELIKSAIERTGLSNFSDIETDVLRGDQLLWLAWNGKAIEAAATTHLVKINNKKLLILTACAGHDRSRWLPVREKIEAYAKAEGCKRIRLYGRKGWQRVLPDYRVEHIIMEKALI